MSFANYLKYRNILPIYFVIKENTEWINIENSKKEKKISIEDFALQKVLGKGSFGKVMLVQHKKTSIYYLFIFTISNKQKKRAILCHESTFKEKYQK